MTVKMKKGELILNINDSPESIAHAKTLGFAPVNEGASRAVPETAEPVPAPISPTKGRGTKTQSE